jgi:hypothetical protein
MASGAIAGAAMTLTLVHGMRAPLGALSAWMGLAARAGHLILGLVLVREGYYRFSRGLYTSYLVRGCLVRVVEKGFLLVLN